MGGGAQLILHYLFLHCAKNGYECEIIWPANLGWDEKVWAIILENIVNIMQS